jgi:hypothetical protein
MPNVFSGTVLDQKGNPILQARIQITQGDVVYEGTGSDPKIRGSYTNEKGEFRIQIDEPIDPKKVTLTVTKDGREIRSITNPGATSKITAATLQISAQEGGELSLKGKYKGGEYYFESLGGKGTNGDLIRDEFDANMKELEGLIKNCREKNIALELIITGSESQIPNTDNEPLLPDGKTKNPNYNKPLTEEKELAKRRVEYLNKRITKDLFTSENGRWANYYNPTISLQVNGPVYPGNADYTQYQYVSVSAKPAKCLCITTYITPTAASAGEIKSIPYIPSNAKYISFVAFGIPDRFGFNNYLLPYYIFHKMLPQNVPAEDWRNPWSILIYMFLYLSNNKSTAFLDVTTPGLKLNYTTLINKNIYGGGTAADINEYNKNSLKYYIEQLKDTLNPSYTESRLRKNIDLIEAFDRLLIDYPNEFTVAFRNPDGSISPKPVTPSDPYEYKRRSIDRFFQNLIDNNIKIAGIDVRFQEDVSIDITLPECGLTPTGLGNTAIGISSDPVRLASQWAYVVCDQPFHGWPRGSGGGG